MADLAPANENEYRCPICDVPMQPDDICAADVNLGICHAHCLDGVPVVSLDTGELVDGPISTFRFREEEDEQPRYNTKRLRQEIERARENDARRIAELERELVDLRTKLLVFSWFNNANCALVKRHWWRGREVVICPNDKAHEYLARGFRWDWRETANVRATAIGLMEQQLKEATRRLDEAENQNAQLREELAIARKDSERLDLLRDNSWDLRCFEIHTGGGDADVGWRVIGHWQAKPNERTVGEVFKDDPRAAIDDAAHWLQEGKPA